MRSYLGAPLSGADVLLPPVSIHARIEQCVAAELAALLILTSDGGFEGGLVQVPNHVLKDMPIENLRCVCVAVDATAPTLRLSLP